ncbi:21 kDa protein-like [Triticum dicoccoides]|uniref:21 kDa protein-like n=1 Tax=Triticum dicoccoides TaxID=85692 RepID=UPI000E7A0371|nr:21 kDa protein-like [Triticum dicoccoides]
MPRSGALPLLAALVLALAAAAAASASNAKGAPAATDFIRKSCRETQYPSVCMQSLSSYGKPPPRSPQELARAALSVSADRARSASAYVGRICGPGLRSGSGAKAKSSPARDCLENMADSVGHLRDAAKELDGSLGRAGSPAFRWHLSNVQTWCSAALTDENTCLDGLSRGVDAGTRAAIRSKVVEVAQVTSNALALVNKVGSGH